MSQEILNINFSVILEKNKIRHISLSQIKVYIESLLKNTKRVHCRIQGLHLHLYVEPSNLTVNQRVDFYW